MNENWLNDGERIDQLYSKDIQIIQSDTVFAFSLDAVLLAYFAKVPKKSQTRIVDLCAGNGAVGLFLSSETAGQISEVEIQPRLADMAERSIKLNGLTEQMKVYNMDLANVTDVIEKDSVDVVTCNPPYFSDHALSKKNPNEYLAIARHELKTTLSGVMKATADVLKMNAKAYFVYRPDRLDDLFSEMKAHRLAPKKIQFVYPKPNTEANMVLVEAIKDGKPNGVRIQQPLIVYNNQNEYGDEVRGMLYGINR